MTDRFRFKNKKSAGCALAQPACFMDRIYFVSGVSAYRANRQAKTVRFGTAYVRYGAYSTSSGSPSSRAASRSGAGLMIRNSAGWLIFTAA